MDKESLNEAQLLRIKSEIARNEAEQRKFVSEANELERRTTKGIFHIDSIVKATIGGIVAAALLAAWAISYLQPLLQKKEELASIENKILEFKNQQQAQYLLDNKAALDSLRGNANKQLIYLNTENDSLKHQQLESKKLIESLGLQLNKISHEYQNLSKQNELTKKDKETYGKLAEEAQRASAKLKADLVSLAISQQKTENRSSEISDQLIANMLISSTWQLEAKWQTVSDIQKEVWSFLADGHVSSDNYYYSSRYIRKWKVVENVLTITSLNLDNSTVSAVFIAKISKLQSNIEGAGHNNNYQVDGDWKITKYHVPVHVSKFWDTKP